MNNKIIILIGTFVISFFLSCNNSSYDSFLKETTQSSFKDELQRLKAIVVLPGQGCGGCITEVENFLINNSQEYDNVIYILTNIFSKKILYQKLGDSICNSSKVYIDSDNKFINTRFKEAQYPAMLYIEKGQIINIEYQNPNNPAATIQLTKWLSKQ